MEKSNAIQILSSRKEIKAPGAYNLKVTSAVPHTREDGTQVTIINLNAMTSYHVGQAKAALKDGDYQSATNFALSTNLLPGRGYTPAKGEIIKANIDWFTNKDGIDALGVTSVSEIPTSKATSVDFSSFEDEEEADVDVNDMSLVQLKAFIAENDLAVNITPTMTLATARKKVAEALAQAQLV